MQYIIKKYSHLLRLINYGLVIMLEIWLSKYLQILSQGKRVIGKTRMGKNGGAWAMYAGSLILTIKKGTSK